MAKQRILEFATYAGSGGTQQEIVKLARHLSREKYAVTVSVLLAGGLLNEEAARLQLDTVSFGMRGYWDLAAWWKFYRFAKGKQFDLVRTYGLKGHIVGRIVGKLFLKIPVNITTIHSTDPWRTWYHALLDRLTAPLVDLHISNSEAGRLAAHRRERVPLEKIITIPNGVNFADYAPYLAERQAFSAKCRAEFGIPADAPVIGIVANLRKMKGHVTIVDALPQMLARAPHLKCLFIGEDLMGGEIQRYIHARGLEQAIILTGDRRDVPALLAALDVFLLPSLWEGLPTSIVEAMAMQTPVVASSVGGIPELVEHGVTGYLIPPQHPAALAEAVTHLLAHPELARQFGRAGYDRARRDFSMDAVVAKTEAAYDRLLAQRGRAA